MQRILYLFFITVLSLACSKPETSPQTKHTPNMKGVALNQAVNDADFAAITVLSSPRPPAYPAEAMAAHIEGTVVVALVVGPDGVPISAQGVDGPPELHKATEDYFIEWRFSPVLLKGIPQTVRFKLTAPWRLRK